MKIYITLDDKNFIEGWADRRSSDEEIEIDIDSKSEFFMVAPYSYKYENGEIIKADDVIVKIAKERKDIELNKACQKAIMDGFEHTINGKEYHFSYDTQAQINFGDSRQLLNDGIIEETPWTVTLNGEYERIDINKSMMDELTEQIFFHKQRNISKYRDILMPKVEIAKTVEEVNAINWNQI